MSHLIEENCQLRRLWGRQRCVSEMWETGTGSKILASEKQNTRKKNIPVPFSHFPTQIQHTLAWDFTRSSKVRYRQVTSLIVTEGYLFNESLIYHQVKLKNSTFCPHSLFMCFVWISGQTAIISLYGINWLVFITETECVYCAVRTESLYTIPRSAHTLYLCVLCGSQNKQRLFPYTALTDWFV